jgi:hypothetical protein
MNRLSKDIANLSAEQRTILELRLKKKRESVSPIQRIPRQSDLNCFPLSFAQERLWFLHQLEPNNSVYNVPRAVRFRGQLNLVAIEQSFNEIVRRHEALRACFVTVDGQPVQE